jgi:hypothetical protein
MSAEAADPTIKRIVLTGDVAESLNPKSYDSAGGSKKTRRHARGNVGPTKVIKEGGGTSPGTLVQLSASHTPGSNATKAVGAQSPFTEGAPRVGPISPSIGGGTNGNATANNANANNANNANAKVILAKTRKKILLAPKNTSAAAKSEATTGGASTVKRKTAKKIRVNISGLGNKLHRAKTIRKRASDKDLAEVKKELVKAKLIKEDSKAPEEIIRQIYSDYMVLKKRAL